MGGVSRSLAAVSLLLSLSSASAFAQDEGVAKRLTKFGQLRRGESESLTADVSKRMRRAADMTSGQDPLRMAVARALGTPNTNDAMVAAKVRLRLYAGLNEWALDKLFAPRAGGIAQCQQDIGLSSRHCEALIAAAGKVPAAQASKLAAGPAAAPARTTMAKAPVQGPSRFGQRFDSGFKGGNGAAPAQRPMPATAARPAPAPMVAAAPTNTRAEYQRKRQEYLDRQKREMEARKQKIVATAVGDVAQRGPASAAEAEVVGLPPSEAPAETSTPAQAKAAPAGKGKPAADEAPAEEAPAEEAPKKEALDNSFLEGLLDDPLGGKK
jgi:hypothetical protein